MNPKLIAEIIGGIAVAIGFLIFQVKKTKRNTFG